MGQQVFVLPTTFLELFGSYMSGGWHISDPDCFFNFDVQTGLTTSIHNFIISILL